METKEKNNIKRADFFNIILGIIKEKGLLPDILDYALATSEKGVLDTYRFEIESRLHYGGSEGIYLDLGIRRCRNGRMIFEELGTIKTLSENDEAMRTMGALLGSFVAESRRYVDDHLEEFDRSGFHVKAINFDNKKNYGSYYFFETEEEAKEKAEILLRCSCYVAVKVFDVKTEEEKEYIKEGYMRSGEGYIPYNFM